MSIKHNLFACLGRKGIIATTTGMIAVGGAGLAIEKITKPDNKKHTEEAVVSINAGGKDDYETTLSDNSKIAEGEGDDNSFNIVMLPVFEKSADLSFFNEIMTGIETDTSFDRLLEEGGSSIEQAIIEKSQELEKAKKNYEGAEERFKELTIEECNKCGIDVLALECHVDHVHIFVSVLPTMSIPSIMKQIKGATSVKLREEFPRLKAMPSLWTRSYFVSTAGNVSSETIKWYVDTQKTRP